MGRDSTFGMFVLVCVFGAAALWYNDGSGVITEGASAPARAEFRVADIAPTIGSEDVEVRLTTSRVDPDDEGWLLLLAVDRVVGCISPGMDRMLPPEDCAEELGRPREVSQDATGADCVYEDCSDREED